VSAPAVDRGSETASATAPLGSGGLVRAELRRFIHRRFIQLLLGLAVLGWLVAVVVGLTQFGHPSAGDLAAARQQVAQVVEQGNANREECLAHPPQLPPGQSAERVCGPPITARDVSLDQFLARPPFSLADAGTSGALGFGAVAAVLGFLIGATWIGAEWSSRSIVALLFWETRRSRVMAAKVGVLAGATALVGVVVQAAWLAMAGILNAVAGNGAGVPAGFWGHLFALQGRGVLLTVLAGLVGFGLANLTRNTGAALGAGFVYFAVLETAVRVLRPTWQPWLLSNNAVALMNPGGLRIWIRDNFQGHDYLIHNLPAGIVLAGVTVVVVALGAVLFARRDLH
jgi:ABC-2 family transporter protein